MDILKELVEDFSDDHILQGDIIGWYIEGHIDPKLFLELAKIEYKAWREEQYYEGDDDEGENEESELPCTVNDVKHLWLKTATAEESEEEGVSEGQILLAYQPEKKYNPATYLTFVD